MNEFDLNFGAQVLCIDGKCGSLSKVAVNPETWQVTHLIVEKGFLLKQARAFPFSWLERTAPAEIYFTAHSDELQNCPVYREEIVDRPAPEQGNSGSSAFWREGVPYGIGSPVPLLTIGETIRHGVPDNSVVVEQGTPVEGLDGSIGKLDHFLVGAEAGEITQIIVRQGLLQTTKTALPAYLARSISEEGIFVESTVEEVESLAEYKAGEDDTQSVETSNVSVSHNTGRPAANGGNMDLTTSVALALSEDSRTSSAVIEVIDERGVITLDGEVDSPAAREAAKEIAAAQPGVTTVVNLLRVRQ